MRTGTCSSCGDTFKTDTKSGPVPTRCPACENTHQTKRSKRYRDGTQRLPQVGAVPAGYLTRKDLGQRWGLLLAGVQSRLSRYDHERNFFNIKAVNGQWRKVMAITTKEADRIAALVEEEVRTRSLRGAESRWGRNKRVSVQARKVAAKASNRPRKVPCVKVVGDSPSGGKKPQNRPPAVPELKTVSGLAARFIAYRNSLLAAVPKSASKPKPARDYGYDVATKAPPPVDLREEWDHPAYNRPLSLDVGEWE